MFDWTKEKNQIESKFKYIKGMHDVQYMWTILKKPSRRMLQQAKRDCLNPVHSIQMVQDNQMGEWTSWEAAKGTEN
jgi:hypothetical protein